MSNGITGLMGRRRQIAARWARIAAMAIAVAIAVGSGSVVPAKADQGKVRVDTSLGFRAY